MTRVPYPVTHITGFAASRTDDTVPVIVSGTAPAPVRSGVFNGPDPVANRLDNPDIHFLPTGIQGLGADGSPRFIVRRTDGTHAIYKGPDPTADFVMDLSAYSKASSYRENARGDVLFMAGRPGGGFGLYSGPDPVANRVLDDTTPLGPAAAYMNDNGKVVYLGRVGDSLATALYAGTDPATDRIIGVGDMLFGSEIMELGVNPQDGAAFNNRNQLVFHYQLRDTRRGIAVVTVPEPAGPALVLALVVAGAGAAPLLRGRKAHVRS